MTSVTYSPSARSLNDHSPSNSSQKMDDQSEEDQYLFDPSQSFAKGIKNQLRELNTSIISNHEHHNSNDSSFLRTISKSKQQRNSIISADQYSFQTAEENYDNSSINISTNNDPVKIVSSDNNDKLEFVPESPINKDLKNEISKTPESSSTTTEVITNSQDSGSTKQSNRTSDSVKRSSSIIGVSLGRSNSSIGGSISATPVVTTTTTNAVGTLSKNQNSIKDKVANIAENHNVDESNEFNEDFGKANDKPKAIPSNYTNHTVSTTNNKQKSVPAPIKVSSANNTKIATPTATPSKRRSFFGFSNRSQSSNISAPILISDSRASTPDHDKLKVPEALQQVQQQQKELYGDMHKNFIPTQNENVNTSTNTISANDNNNDKQKRFSRLPSRKPSSNSLFVGSNSNVSSSANGPSPNRGQSQPQPQPKTKNSLSMFFKYRKSPSTNNLYGSLRGGNKAASSMDLNSQYKNDSYSVVSMDNRSISSNATTRTSISTFKKNILNKFKSKTGSSKNTSSSVSLFSMKLSGNQSINRRNDNDAASIRTSNTANFNYAIANMSAEKRKDFDDDHNIDMIEQDDDDLFSTPKRKILASSINNDSPSGHSTIKKSSTTPSNQSKQSSGSYLSPGNESTGAISDIEPLPTFDEGDVLFPKSLDLKEVNNIVQIERKLSTKRADSMKRKSNRNSIEVKAKEDGMTIEFGKDVNEPPTTLKKTNSILKKKKSLDKAENENKINEEDETHSVGVIVEAEKESDSPEPPKNIPEKNQGVEVVPPVTPPAIVINNEDNEIVKDNIQPPSVSTTSKRSSTNSSVDFGIKFEDSNLDLDFPDFATSVNNVNNTNVPSSDDVSSRSFESNDDSENIQAVSRDDLITGIKKDQQKQQEEEQVKQQQYQKQQQQQQQQEQQQRYQRQQQQQQSNKSRFNNKPQNNNAKNNKGGFKINNFVKNRFTSSSDQQNNQNNYNNSFDHQNYRYPATNTTSPVKPQTPPHQINNNRYGHHSTLSSSSTISNHSNSDYHYHKRNNLSSISFNTSNESPRSSENLPRSNSKYIPHVKFSSRIILYETYNPDDYDRHPEIATCNQLTPLLAQQIKEELNTFKAEMPIHERSRSNTQFF